MKPRAVFIAGTDTGVGKNFAACALLHALRAAGLTATGMKPIATGCQATADGLRDGDTTTLIAASDPRPANYRDANPLAFAAAASPYVAASEAGETVTLEPIEDAYDTLALLGGDTIVVEGIGGWLTPISESLRANAIPRQLNLPVILIVGLRSGCANHAQLAARAIHADGCVPLGWIGNRIDPEMAHPKETLVTLSRSLGMPCLGVIPYGITPVSAAAALRDAADAVRDAR